MFNLSYNKSFAKFAKEQDEKFVSNTPDAKDSKAFEKVQKGAIDLLEDVGFSRQEMGESWNGQKEFSLRDARIQELIRDAYLFRESKKSNEANKKSLADKKKSTPPVQRPGAAQTSGAAQISQIQALEKQLPEARGNKAIRIAAELMALKRAL